MNEELKYDKPSCRSRNGNPVYNRQKQNAFWHFILCFTHLFCKRVTQWIPYHRFFQNPVRYDDALNFGTDLLNIKHKMTTPKIGQIHLN